MSKIARAWPEVDERSQDVQIAINNAFANLPGYPHHLSAERERDVAAAQTEVERVFSKWRNFGAGRTPGKG